MFAYFPATMSESLVRAQFERDHPGKTVLEISPVSDRGEY